MDNWAEVFSSYANSGVYTITQPKNSKVIKKAAASNKCVFIRVDLKRAKDKEGFLKKTSKGLNFPTYFGNNWDAFKDCLTDMSWWSTDGYVILFDHFLPFSEADPEVSQILNLIFKSSIEYWKQNNVPFYILLS